LQDRLTQEREKKAAAAKEAAAARSKAGESSAPDKADIHNNRQAQNGDTRNRDRGRDSRGDRDRPDDRDQRDRPPGRFDRSAIFMPTNLPWCCKAAACHKLAAFCACAQLSFRHHDNDLHARSPKLQTPRCTENNKNHDNNTNNNQDYAVWLHNVCRAGLASPQQSVMNIPIRSTHTTALTVM